MSHRVERVEQAIVAAAAASSAEHADVGRRLDKMGERFDGALEKRDKEIEALKKVRNEGAGVAKLVQTAKGAALLLLAALPFLLSKGGPG